MEFVQLLPLVAIVLLFWVMLVRPASRRQKELARLQESLQPGQQVMLAAGIFGAIRSISADRVRVEVSPGVDIEVVRGAISRVVDPVADGGQTDGPDGPGADPDAGERP